MVSSTQDGPRVGCCEHSEGCRGQSKSGLLWTWCMVQRMIQGWAVVNMVNGAEYGLRVGCCEHSEGCRGRSKSGLLWTWCMHFIKMRNSLTTRLATYLSFPCCAWHICEIFAILFMIYLVLEKVRQNEFSFFIWTLGCIWKLWIAVRMYWQNVTFRHI